MHRSPRLARRRLAKRPMFPVAGMVGLALAAAACGSSAKAATTSSRPPITGVTVTTTIPAASTTSTTFATQPTSTQAPPTSTTSTTFATQPTSTQAPTTTTVSPAIVVRVADNAKLGSILVDARGLTLYHYSLDTSKKSDCVTGNCVPYWPPLLLPAGTDVPGGGSGVTGLGTLRRPGGRLQVTYRGMPLYTFFTDTSPGQTTGQGKTGADGPGGVWHVVHPSG